MNVQGGALRIRHFADVALEWFLLSVIVVVIGW